MSRPAGHLASGTGHGGTIVEGSADVLVNGKPAIAVGHAAACPKHGKSTVATGKNDVLVNGALMARLKDRVLCAGPPKPGQGDGALVDHGEPTFRVGDYELHHDGSLTDVPEEELADLAEAIASRDPAKIRRAYENLPTKALAGKRTIKVVDRANPNYWIVIEDTGPGVTSNQDPLNPAMPRVDVSPGGGRIRAGGSVQEAGSKVTFVRRHEDDGAIKETRISFSGSQSKGASVDGEWSDKRRGFAIDLPSGGGGSVEEVVIEGAAGRLMPSLDDIVPPVSPDVLLGE